MKLTLNKVNGDPISISREIYHWIALEDIATQQNSMIMATHFNSQFVKLYFYEGLDPRTILFARQQLKSTATIIEI